MWPVLWQDNCGENILQKWGEAESQELSLTGRHNSASRERQYFQNEGPRGNGHRQACTSAHAQTSFADTPLLPLQGPLKRHQHSGGPMTGDTECQSLAPRFMVPSLVAASRQDWQKSQMVSQDLGEEGCQMAQQVQVLVAKAEDLSSISETHMVEIENRLLQVVF